MQSEGRRSQMQAPLPTKPPHNAEPLHRVEMWAVGESLLDVKQDIETLQTGIWSRPLARSRMCTSRTVSHSRRVTVCPKNQSCRVNMPSEQGRRQLLPKTKSIATLRARPRPHSHSPQAVHVSLCPSGWFVRNGLAAVADGQRPVQPCWPQGYTSEFKGNSKTLKAFSETRIVFLYVRKSLKHSPR